MSANLYFRIGNKVEYLQAVSDGQGWLSYEFGPWLQPAALLISPVNFWSRLIRGPIDGVEVELTPLPLSDHPWWHDASKSALGLGGLGARINVGVSDTGCGPHPSLAHVKLVGAFIDGAHITLNGATDDVDDHGSHVCGIIGARSLPGSPLGIASECNLFAARIFPRGGGANQGDVANAIDYLSKEQYCHLINLSIGSAEGSQIERDAIIDALERGTVCVCASGNNAPQPVEYPAAHAEAVAVSAIGLEGWPPADSSSAMHYPMDKDWYGQHSLFMANFSCSGPKIAACGPGVGILSTVPSRAGYQQPWMEMSGTSMASPAACGLLAVALSADPVFPQLPPNIQRGHYIVNKLASISKSIGLSSSLEGKGLPVPA